VNLLLLCLSIAQLAVAQNAAPGSDSTVARVSLKQVLQRAVRDPPSVLAASATLARVSAERKYAQGAYFPSLTGQATAGFLYDNRLVLPNAPRIDSKSRNVEGSLTLQWAALDAARGPTIDAARAATRAQRFALRSAERDALLLASELYVGAWAAHEQVIDAALTLERRSSQHAAIAGLVGAGTRSPVDAQRAEIEVLSARYALAARKHDQLAAFAALAAATGEPPSRLMRPASSPGDAFVVVIDPKRARALAYTHRPELHQWRAVVLSKREEHRAAVGARFPTLGISATGSASHVTVLSGQGIDGYQYGGSAVAYLRWSGLDPAVWLRADVADAAIPEAQRQLQAALHAIGAEAVNAAYVLARTKTERDRAEAVLAAARVTREAQNGRYRTGLASLLELLDAENLEQEARQRRIEAERDHQIAGARLLSACGILHRLAR
jgi:outer membrane protein TolC